MILGQNQLILNDFMKHGKLQVLLLEDNRILVNDSKGTRQQHVELEMKLGNDQFFPNIVRFKVNIKYDG